MIARQGERPSDPRPIAAIRCAHDAMPDAYRPAPHCGRVRGRALWFMGVGPSTLISEHDRKAATIAALVALSVTTAPWSAARAEYCVTCTEPDATYVCEIRGLATQAPAGMQGQLLCIKELAAASGHKTCSVSRTAPATCSGPLRVLSAPQPADVPSIAAPKPPAPDAVAPIPADRASAAKPNGPLETVGQGITAAAKKSWSCVSSLFKDC